MKNRFLGDNGEITGEEGMEKEESQEIKRETIRTGNPD